MGREAAVRCAGSVARRVGLPNRSPVRGVDITVMTDRVRPLAKEVPTPSESFADFVEPHWAVMARLARRLSPSNDWEDVLQEALAAAWRKWAQFDPERGSARNWLLAIVVDRSYKRRRQTRVVVELVEQHADRRSTEVDVDIDLRRAVDRLSRRQRSAVILYYYLGLPLAEVAQVMTCAVGTVKSTLADSRARLHQQLGDDYR
jgi:RNA polymerase sigma-70 factor, ECF subfamily